MRLQVYLSHSGVCSRRVAEGLILSGRVKVNSLVVLDKGSKVESGDVVTLDGKSITLEKEKRYVLLNKPAGYVCTLQGIRNLNPEETEVEIPHLPE